MNRSSGGGLVHDGWAVALSFWNIATKDEAIIVDVVYHTITIHTCIIFVWTMYVLQFLSHLFIACSVIVNRISLTLTHVLCNCG